MISNNNDTPEICGLTTNNDSEQYEQGPISYDDLKSRDTRALIFHLLYAMECLDYTVSLNSIVDNFNRGFELAIPTDSKVFIIAQSIIDNREALDKMILPLLVNWRFDRIGVCTKLILRFALWELTEIKTVHSIVINEAIELAKCFAEHDAYKFVNGVLDEAVKKMGLQAPESQSV
jgi:transcription antitermination factor NusB